MSKMKILGTLMQLVKTRDPWYNIGYYIRNPPIWALIGRAGLSIPQQKVVDAFSEVQSAANDAGLDRWQRRRLTARVMSVGAGGFGGTKIKKPRRVAVPKAEYDRAIASAGAIVARYK